MLRREGYSGRIVMLSADNSAPCDRPNLSKDFLAGNAPETWVSLRSPQFYREHDIDLELGRHAASLDVSRRRLLDDGERLRQRYSCADPKRSEGQALAVPRVSGPKTRHQLSRLRSRTPGTSCRCPCGSSNRHTVASPSDGCAPQNQERTQLSSCPDRSNGHASRQNYQ